MLFSAVIKTKNGNTLEVDFPNNIYKLYEQLSVAGISQPPHRINLTETDDIRVKLSAESDIGKHLILTFNKQDTIADANLLAAVVSKAPPEIQDELEQSILYDQYASMREVINDIRQMRFNAGQFKETFYCPLVGSMDDEYDEPCEMDSMTLDSYSNAIEEAIEADSENDESDMAEFFNEDAGVKAKLISARWGVESQNGRLYGKIECSLREKLTEAETEVLREWISGQNSDGIGEHFEQQPIDTDEGDLYVSFWHSGKDYKVMTGDEFETYIEDRPFAIGGI